MKKRYEKVMNVDRNNDCELCVFWEESISSICDDCAIGFYYKERKEIASLKRNRLKRNHQFNFNMWR